MDDSRISYKASKWPVLHDKCIEKSMFVCNLKAGALNVQCNARYDQHMAGTLNSRIYMTLFSFTHSCTWAHMLPTV